MIEMNRDWLNKPLKVIKTWQTNNFELVLQLSFSGLSSKNVPLKKFFLIIDAKQSSFGLRFQESKPEFQLFTNPLINLWRKYYPNALLFDFLEHEKSGDWWFYIANAGDESFHARFKLAKSRPPEIALLNQQDEVIVRHSMKGTYTKKRHLEEERPDPQSQNSNWISRKAELLQNFLKAIVTSDNLLEDSETTEPEDLDSSMADAINISPEQRTLLNKLKRRLKTAKKAFEKQTQDIPSVAELEKAKKEAKLLQTYAYLVKEGDFELKLSEDLTKDGIPVTIALNPDVNLGTNIESYFTKVKKLQRALKMGSERFEKNKRELDQLESTVERLKIERVSDHDLSQIYQHYRLPNPFTESNSAKSNLIKSHQSNETAKPYKIFQSSSGHLILVGKGPRENDELTKSAKSNDYWLHAAGVAGSHVIVPVTKDIREKIPDELTREAAILVLNFSKNKGSFAGEVYVARKGDIKKKKGMPAGLWNVDRCKTQFIRYESEELNAVLNRLIP